LTAQYIYEIIRLVRIIQTLNRAQIWNGIVRPNET
jgi:hypothetical protein